MKTENEIKQKAQELLEKYRDFLESQDDFYSTYKAEFAGTRELDLLIYNGIQINYKLKEYFNRLAELIDNTLYEKQG